MYPYRITYAPVSASAAGLASAVAYSGTGLAVTTNEVSDGLCHLITVGGLAATDHTAKTFTVVGVGPNGKAQSEDLAGPNGVATITTTKYFKSVTSVLVSATTGADTFNIGWATGAVSSTFPLNWRQQNFQVSLGLVITGTVNVTVQHCLESLQGDPITEGNETWWPHSTLANKTASADGNYAFPVVATRFLVNSVTNGATVSFSITQAR